METISIWDLPAFKNIDRETCTPDWNIKYFETELKKHKHWRKNWRKKMKEELRWWKDAKKDEERINTISEDIKNGEKMEG